MVTPSSSACEPASVLSGSVVSTVPPTILPLLMALRPPVLNTPALLMSSVLPVLFKVPVRLTMLPAPRMKVPSVAVT